MAVEIEFDGVEDDEESTQELMFDDDRSYTTACDREVHDEGERYPMSEADHWQLFEEFVDSIGILSQSDSFAEIYPELQILEVSPEQEERYFY